MAAHPLLKDFAPPIVTAGILYRLRFRRVKFIDPLLQREESGGRLEGECVPEEKTEQGTYDGESNCCISHHTLRDDMWHNNTFYGSV